MNLIVLLVVIAILSMLAAMLPSALTKVKGSTPWPQRKRSAELQRRENQADNRPDPELCAPEKSSLRAGLLMEISAGDISRTRRNFCCP